MVDFTVPLDKGWVMTWSGPDGDPLATKLDDWDWKTIPHAELSDAATGGMLWLRKRFTLDATDSCLRYSLRCTRVPCKTQVILRGQRVADISAGSDLALDVTNYLSLDNNVLMLALEDGLKVDAVERIRVWLEARFCD